MSRRSSRVLQQSFQVQLQPVAIPLPPHTRAFVQQNASYSKVANREQKDRRHFSTKTRRFYHSSDARRDGGIPFEFGDSAESEPKHQSSLLDDNDPQKDRRSTLTASEKAIFNRIFEEAPQSSNEVDPKEDSMEEEPLDSDDPFTDLNTIFDNAIRKLHHPKHLQQPDGQRPEAMSDVLEGPRTKAALRKLQYKPVQTLVDFDPRAPERKPHALRPQNIRPLEIIDGRVVPYERTESQPEEALKKACEDHGTLVKQMLHNSTTDVEIWNILEKEVFTMLRHLLEQIEFEKKASNPDPRKKGKRRKTRRAPLPTPNPLDSTSSSTIPVGITLSILLSNYASYTLLAMRLWRLRHPTTSYSLHLLPHIKSLGPISYVLGTSTGLYNEVLFLRWTRFSDLHAIADLLQEMINQGLDFNSVTLALLGQIDKARWHDLRGRNGKVLQARWNLMSVTEAWARLRQLYSRVKDEVVERETSRETEVEEEEEDEDEEAAAAAAAEEKAERSEVSGPGWGARLAGPLLAGGRDKLPIGEMSSRVHEALVGMEGKGAADWKARWGRGVVRPVVARDLSKEKKEWPGNPEDLGSLVRKIPFDLPVEGGG